MDQDHIERVSLLFKALADPARLRILGLLAQQPMAGHELADQLELTAPTISHHMRRLTEAGLVQATPEAQSRVYSLQMTTIRELSRSTAQQESSPERDGDEERVLRAFFDGPRLRLMPAARKKRVIVLRHLLAQFTPGRDYPEAEVNAILGAVHDDYASLRRELVDYGYLSRDKGIYRVAEELPARGPTVRKEVGDESHWFARFVTDATERAMSESLAPIRETPDGPRE
jgi:biotin operon repressor